MNWIILNLQLTIHNFIIYNFYLFRHSEKQIILDIYRQNGCQAPTAPTHRQPLGLVNGQQHHDAMVTASHKQPITYQHLYKGEDPTYQSIRNTGKRHSRVSQDSCSDVLRMQDSLSDSGLADIGQYSAHRPMTAAPPSFQRLSLPEQDRQTAIQKLLSVEEKFLCEMQQGHQRFSEPLQHNLLSPTEYSTLYQNITEVSSNVAI